MDDIKLVPGKKLCTLCRTNLQALCHQQDISSSSTDQEDDNDEPADESIEIETNISALLVSVGDSLLTTGSLG